MSEALLSNEGMSDWRVRLGSRLAAAFEARGLRVTSLRSDLAVLGRSLEGFLASTVLFAVGGLLFGPVLVAAGDRRRGAARASRVGRHGAAVRAARRPAAAAVGAAGGRGPAAGLPARGRRVPRPGLDEPGRWSRRARGAHRGGVDRRRLAVGPAARHAGRSPGCRASRPWAALGRLGDEVGINELRDLAAALALVADDGAKIRDSLAARAATLRRRELAEMEGRAGERSQSMLVAQMLIVLGYLLFLAYPAVIRIL